jgi:Fe-S cluster biogenesis protein NfuA
MSFWSKLIAGDADLPLPKGPRSEFESRVESVLEEIRPMLHSDGGDIELVAVEGRSAKVKLVGACDGCASAALTLRYGIEKKLREEIEDFEDLIPV